MRFCCWCGAALPARPPVRCPACDVEHFTNAKPCAGALVMQDGRLLLVRRAIDPFRGWWDIPGGFCDEPEHPADAARREVREETGFDAEITGFIGMWLDTYPNPGDSEHPVTTLNSYFHAVVTGSGSGAVDPTEAIELGWFAPGALPSEIAFIDHVGAVLDAWRADVAAGRTVTPMPDRPGPA